MGDGSGDDLGPPAHRILGASPVEHAAVTAALSAAAPGPGPGSGAVPALERWRRTRREALARTPEDTRRRR